MVQQVVLSFFSYDKNKFWAFTQMQRAIPQLQQQPGIQFFRTLGTGAGLGFSLWPDFSTYALLTVWESEAAATTFLDSSALMETHVSKSASQKHFSLHTLQSHGLWGKSNPFTAEKRDLHDDEKIGIITRATLRPSRLLEFWWEVPAASKPYKTPKGCCGTKGLVSGP